MDPYLDEFRSGVEGAPRGAVKRLTRDIEHELVAVTINAPDWYALSFNVYRISVSNVVRQGYSLRCPNGSRLAMGRPQIY
jgi:hypothetical protein